MRDKVIDTDGLISSRPLRPMARTSTAALLSLFLLPSALALPTSWWNLYRSTHDTTALRQRGQNAANNHPAIAGASYTLGDAAPSEHARKRHPNYPYDFPFPATFTDYPAFSIVSAYPAHETSTTAAATTSASHLYVTGVPAPSQSYATASGPGTGAPPIATGGGWVSNTTTMSSTAPLAWATGAPFPYVNPGGPIIPATGVPPPMDGGPLIPAMGAPTVTGTYGPDATIFHRRFEGPRRRL